MKPADFDIWLLQPLSALEFLCYRVYLYPEMLQGEGSDPVGCNKNQHTLCFFPFIFRIPVWAERAFVLEYKKIIMRMFEI